MGVGNRGPLDIPPGVSRGATPAKASGRWWEANLVRWVNGVLRPVPGWEKQDYPATASKIRATHTWADNSGIIRTALLCENHVYILDGGQLINISPVPALEGPSANLFTGGYGDWDYNDGDYGDPRPDKERIRAIGHAYTLENWGEDLLVMTSTDGRLLRWQPSVVGGIATAVPNAPIGNRTFVVTPERHVILFQKGGDARTWGWCDREDIENWDMASVTSTAGEYQIEPSSPIIAAKSNRYGVVCWTSIGVHFIRYVGLPYVYSIAEKIGDFATPVSSQAIATYADNVIWYAEDGFWRFDGNSITPLPCELLDWVKQNSNQIYLRYRTCAVSIGVQPEIWFFFPSGTSTENDRYVSYHFYDRWWSMGKLKRTCGSASSYTTFPTMSDGTNVFLHEKGWFYGGNELPYAETNSLNIGDGVQSMTLKQLIADTASEVGAVLFDFFYGNTRVRNGTPLPGSKLSVPVRPDGYVDVRKTARDFRIRIRTKQDGAGDWSFGKFLMEIAGRGRR